MIRIYFLIYSEIMWYLLKEAFLFSLRFKYDNCPCNLGQFWFSSLWRKKIWITSL